MGLNYSEFPNNSMRTGGEVGMTYSKGHKMISIEKKPILGKVKPELFIGEGNQLLKVATFGNIEKAEKFDEWLRYFFGDMLEKVSE